MILNEKQAKKQENRKTSQNRKTGSVGTLRYQICGNELDHIFEEKDLGVTIDFELKFEQHFTQIMNKANTIMGITRRSFSFLDSNLFKKLYTTFVFPHLGYTQAVWAPYSCQACEYGRWIDRWIQQC